MRLSEKALLDGYQGLARGGDIVSIVRGTRIAWTYRTGRDSDGYNPVCAREKANEITLEQDRVGTLPLGNQSTHPTVARISQDEQQLWGAEVI